RGAHGVARTFVPRGDDGNDASREKLIDCALAVALAGVASGLVAVRPAAEAHVHCRDAVFPVHRVQPVESAKLVGRPRDRAVLVAARASFRGNAEHLDGDDASTRSDARGGGGGTGSDARDVRAVVATVDIGVTG